MEVDVMSAVTLTESAAYEVKDMLKNHNLSHGYLRFKVQGGGCTGLTYAMAAEETVEENDVVYEYYGVNVLVNRHDIPVINGTVIDFKQSLIGGGFTIENPNAILSCGCGTSFRTEKNAGVPGDC